MTTITEWHWNVSLEWEIVAFQGTGEQNSLVIAGRTSKSRIVTTTDKEPRPKINTQKPYLPTCAKHAVGMREARAAHALHMRYTCIVVLVRSALVLVRSVSTRGSRCSPQC